MSTLLAVGTVLLPSARAVETSQIDPAALTRGADPTSAFMVRDTIWDGDLRIQATTRGDHQALWVVAGGYVVRDVNVGDRALTRVVFVSRTGEHRVIARSRQWITVAVSASGRSVAVERPSGPTGLLDVITVSRPESGRILAQREFRMATLAAVTDRQVLIGMRARWRNPATLWWNYAHDTLQRLYPEAALGADVHHNKVIFDQTSVGEFCSRVAVLSHPARTLWKSCRIYPHQWSPNGRHAIATYAYFDSSGTPAWWVVDGRTAGDRVGITGRLDWSAAWEDNSHFLTLAQSDAGKAAIIRCDLTATCERASRLWAVAVPAEPSLNYAAPPVVLASN